MLSQRELRNIRKLPDFILFCFILFNIISMFIIRFYAVYIKFYLFKCLFLIVTLLQWIDNKHFRNQNEWIYLRYTLTGAIVLKKEWLLKMLLKRTVNLLYKCWQSLRYIFYCLLLQHNKKVLLMNEIVWSNLTSANRKRAFFAPISKKCDDNWKSSMLFVIYIFI